MSESNNKRIAKNTLFMYFRMFLTMAVGLFSSRVILQTLGEQDFGIYNVVGGVVVLFTFISNAMNSATQRHISYELSKTGGDVPRVYSACLNIHLWLCVLIAVLTETVGLWFLNAKMNIPAERMDAANWVLQISLINCLLGVIRVPDNATVISFEKMDFYAYMGIVEAVLKLVVIYLLLVAPFDKLILYAFLMLAISAIVNVAFRLYIRRKIPAIQYGINKGKGLYKKYLSFATWTLFGSIANMARSQGVNIIVNLFYGVVLNAAVGIANQVNGHVMGLVAGFQQALNPQLTKAQASCDLHRQFILVCRSSRFSFFLMLIFCYPLLVNLPYVLHIWLGKYPDHTVAICDIIVIGALLETLSGPLWVTLYAIGRIRFYQVIVSFVLLLIIPISYVGGKKGMSAEAMFIISNALLVVNFFIRLVLLRKYINFNVSGFLNDVVTRTMVVSALTILPLFFLPKNWIFTSDITSFVIVSLLLFVYAGLLIAFIGLQKKERGHIVNFAINKIRRR